MGKFFEVKTSVWTQLKGQRTDSFLDEYFFQQFLKDKRVKQFIIYYSKIKFSNTFMPEEPLSPEKVVDFLSSPERVQDENIEKKVEDESSKWKSKSLNSLPTEHYQIDMTKSVKVKSPSLQKQLPKQVDQKENTGKTEGGQKLLPQPKIKKINEKIFCVTIDNQLNVFYHLDNNERSKLKTKKSFGNLKYELGSNIECTVGNGSNFIFVGTDNQLVILEMYKKEDKYFIRESARKQIPGLRGVTFLGDEVIAVSSDQIFQYNAKGQFDLVAKKSIQFGSAQEKKLFGELKTIGLVVESAFCFYLFGTKTEQKLDYNIKRKFAMDAPPPSKLCEVLHIIRFNIEHNLEGSLQGDQNGIKKTRYMSQTQLAESRIVSVGIQIYPIDHVFETGIFEKSKIFEIEEAVFLMSLHEEVILIKKHFNKFIVWDNVSIVSSKSQQKKGQLILADKRILVYSQNGEIFAHDIFFNEGESRINMPPIDSFRGNDNDEEILYDAVLLEYDKDSLMKVLFYFKETDVILPNKSKFRKQTDSPNQPGQDENTLHFTMLCINQSDPKEKLKQMLRLKKQPNQILEFCERFNINSLEKTKCMWSVSDKSLKDIENVLLQIADDRYIQTELDNILKKQPHNLTFLISVEKKQIARLKKLVVRNLLNDHESQAQISEGDNPRDTQRKRVDYVKRVIQWLMESIMLEKKLEYSRNFLSFKEYDFIEIGKLKAASLKEEIKLLSCKKYEKRLKYFLNSFKVLAIANWEQIFRFLLLNKNETEIKQFLVDFPFILPRFVETSNVFQGRTEIDRQALIPREEGEEKCYLWDDLSEIHTLVGDTFKYVEEEKKLPQNDGERPLNTIEDFREMIIANIKALKKDPRIEQEAVENFKLILDQVVESPWFKSAAFKQHSMLNKTSKQLKEEFHELKNRKAYQILVKYLYEQIQKGNPDITVTGVDQMLEFFVEKKLIPQSFKRNDEARLKVYIILERLKVHHRGEASLPKSVYLVWNEDQYFSFLFQKIKSKILTEVKHIYDNVTSLSTGFFRQRFELYLQSKYVNLKAIINFLDEFEAEDDHPRVDAEDVRRDVFNCIKRLLRLGDYQNTKMFIEKSLDKEVLPERTIERENSNYQMSLREEAKIPYGFVFYNFFKAFNLDYTYEELIEATQNSNLASNAFLKELIHKYCAGQHFTETTYEQGRLQSLIRFDESKIINERLSDVDIYNRPLQFFGVLLYMVDILDFQVEETSLYEMIIEEYLNEGRLNQERRLEGESPTLLGECQYESKFEELFGFVRSIENYIMTGQDLNTKNYLLINDFKEQHDAEELFVEYTMGWVARTYSRIQRQQQIESSMQAIQRAIRILQKSNRNAQKVKKMEAFFRLLEFLRKFNPQVLTRIDFIKDELENTGFIFLMHMFHAVGIQNFILSDLEAQYSRLSQEKGSDFVEFYDSSRVTATRVLQRQLQYQEKRPRKKMTTQETNNKVYNWACIFSQFKILKGEEVLDEKQHPDFIRFLVEICCLMVHEQHYEVAWDLLMRSVTQGYYFRDAFYLLASQMQIQDNAAFKDSFEVFLKTETAKQLKIKLNAMIKGGQEPGFDGKVMIFPPERKDFHNDSREKKDGQSEKHSNALFIFQELLEWKREDEAFFFLIRLQGVSLAEIERLAERKGRIPRPKLRSYLLLTVYMKSLQKYISEQFYPTFLFFKSKYEILIDGEQRRDILKDINIAISRLKTQFEEAQQSVRPQLREAKEELYKYYLKFMEEIEEDPVIRLTQEDERQASTRIKMYARMTEEKDEQSFSQQLAAKEKLQENQEKLRQVHQNNKLNVIQKEVAESISEAKRNADKYTAILEEKKKESSRKTYAEKKEEELLEIRKREQEQVASIKDSYKSNTTQKVNQLIEQLRKKREKIGESRYKSSMIREDPNIPSKDTPIYHRDGLNSQQLSKRDLPSSKYNIQVHTPSGNPQTTTSINYAQRASQIVDRARRSFVEPEHPSDNYSDSKSRFRAFQQPNSSKYKVTLEEVTQLFRNKEPEALKYLEKFDLIKQNLQVAVELVKRVYAVMGDLAVFLQFLRYLLGSDPRYKEVLEEKSIPIVAQMLKMDQKINLKELVPVELFTKVHSVTVKDFNSIAYETMRPNLKKILTQEKIAVHALGILMRYSLGSETKYFHKVFADYLTVLVKNYELKVMDEKETFLLAEKLRSQFSNLEPQGRQYELEKILSQIMNEGKRKRLVEALKKAVQRKSDSALMGNQAEQLSRALARLDR